MKRLISTLFVLCCAVAGRAAERVLVFDDAIPGQDRVQNARLVERLRRRGYEVAAGTAGSFAAELVTNRPAALVVPSCQAVPPAVGAAALTFARSGGPTIFLGGPLLDEKLVCHNGRWHTRREMDAQRNAAPVTTPCGPLGAAFDPKLWWRSSSTVSDSFLRREGDELHLSVGPLENWDVQFSKKGLSFFGAEETLFAFTARADEPDTTISLELIARDGSRWIATATFGTAWERKTLAPADFKYWPDSQAKGRGGPGDCLKPTEAQCLGLGVSLSHTPSMNGRRASVHFKEVGSCKDPFRGLADADEKAAAELPKLVLEGVYPRYKLLSNADGARAIARPEGVGFGRGGVFSFQSLTGEQGASAAWTLLERRPKASEHFVAGFGARTWWTEATLAQLEDVLDQMVKGTRLFEGGTDRFVAFPGETVKMGASWRGGADTAELRIWNAANVCVRRATVRNGEAVDWTPPNDPAVYRVETVLGTERREHEFAVVSSEPDPHDAFITVKDGDFWLRGRKWYPVGVNFWPLYVAGMEMADYWPGWMRNEYYSPARVEWDLAHFAAMGGNMISIQAPGVEHVRNLLDVLRRCKRHGIYVNLYLGLAAPLDARFGPHETSPVDRARTLAAYLEAAHLPGHAALVAYDTIWEPGNYVFCNDVNRSRWDARWRAWIDETYGGVAAAEQAWGSSARRNGKGAVTSPPDNWFVADGPWRKQMADYRRFMDRATSRAWNDATRMLRELDPNHLISFRQGNTLPYDFALSGPVRHIDFICPEGYAVPHSDAGEDAIGWITRYVAATTGGKPVVWSEFGKSVWNPDRMEADAATAELQGAYQARFYRTGLAAGANGTVPWWWTGGYRVDERSDFGIVSPDGSERPAATLMRDYAPKITTPRTPRTPDVWMDYDRDAHAGGYCYTAFHDGAQAWHDAQAKGQLLGVRLAGTDQTSVTAERRFLDAEIDTLTCEEMPGGRRVSVVFGNIGTAAWAPAAVGKGGVWLVAEADGTRVAEVPLPCPVPRLGTAPKLQLTIPVTIQGPVSLHLEARNRFTFGEQRTCQ